MRPKMSSLSLVQNMFVHDKPTNPYASDDPKLMTIDSLAILILVETM